MKLKIGDEVVTLIDCGNFPKGSVGKITRIDDRMPSGYEISINVDGYGFIAGLNEVRLK